MRRRGSSDHRQGSARALQVAMLDEMGFDFDFAGVFADAVARALDVTTRSMSQYQIK